MVQFQGILLMGRNPGHQTIQPQKGEGHFEVRLFLFSSIGNERGN